MILVVVDSLRYDAVTHSRGQGNTPNLYKRSQKNGVDFSRHYSQSSWTCSSVASLLTSRMPIQTGVISIRSRKLPDSEKTIMELANESGYITAGFSANHLISGANNFDQGMDELSYVSLNDEYQIPHQGWSNSAEKVGDKALSWIKEHKDLPFNCLYALSRPSLSLLASCQKTIRGGQKKKTIIATLFCMLTSSKTGAQ